jgi:hypothetical protein
MVLFAAACIVWARPPLDREEDEEDVPLEVWRLMNLARLQ